MFGQRLRDYVDELCAQIKETPQLLAVLALAGGLALAALWLYARARPAPMVIASRAPVRASPTTAPSSTATICVDVAGAVVRPGVVLLPKGSRVNDALLAAGGPLRVAALESVNRALVVQDGQQIVVPKRGESSSAAPPGGSSAGPSAAPAGEGQAGEARVEINLATVEQFDSLPGIGPVLAQRIFDYRQEHGRFKRVEDLRQVEGIGPKKFEQLKEKAACTQ